MTDYPEPQSYQQYLDQQKREQLAWERLEENDNGISMGTYTHDNTNAEKVYQMVYYQNRVWENLRAKLGLWD